MKRWIAFILVLTLTSQRLPACVFYPFNEEIRFRLLDPGAFGYGAYSQFRYTASYFGWESLDGDPEQFDGNVQQWSDYCKGRVSLPDIYQAVYELPEHFITDPAERNGMIRYLNAQRDTAALHYLVFAKRSELWNGSYSDPWERRESVRPAGDMDVCANGALQRAARTVNPEIRRRYAFLAIRMAYYTDGPKLIKPIYDQYFAKRKRRNTIDYWALHFRTLTEPDSVLRSFYTAQVFAFAADKRLAIHTAFNNKIPVSRILAKAKSNRERAAVWLLKGVKNPGQALGALEQVARYDPSSPGLGFLLLREMNKLEDWIYTPTYTYFDPSIRDDYWTRNKGYNKGTLKNLSKDKAYARRLLGFVQANKQRRLQHPVAWKAMEAYLYEMLGEPDKSLRLFNVLLRNTRDTQARQQLELLASLPAIARQPAGDAKIPVSLQPVILREHARRNYRYLFALAKELEFKGNTLDAGALLTHTNDYEEYDESFSRQVAYWRAGSNRGTTDFDDYFTTGFFYIDAQYSLGQVKELVTAAANDNDTTLFGRWRFQAIKAELPRYQDLLATKYIRRNRLPEALAILETLPDTLWTSKRYQYKYLDANPFYTNLYNEHQHTRADSDHYTKARIVSSLVTCLARAADTANKDRDLYYFLAANCYLNMGFYGNSWMMRRYSWSCMAAKGNREDDEEFYKCRTAKYYYLRASATARSKKFAALCLRMAARCERNRLQFDYPAFTDDQRFTANQYYTQLNKRYPEYYDDLVLYCNSFEQYYNAR